MTDKLKALALAANVIDHNERAEWYTAGELLERYMTYHKNARFIEAASPDVVLGLLAENERLKSAMNPDWDVKSAALESVREHMEIAAGLRAEIERLKAQEPVAYLMTFNDGTTTIQKSPYWDSCKSVEPLFLASGAAQAAPAAQEVEQKHTYAIELPDGDLREAKVWWTERKATGDSLFHKLSITVSETPSTIEAAPAAQEPLTDDQIDELIITQVEGNNGYHQFVRAIEAAHGIGTQEQK